MCYINLVAAFAILNQFVESADIQSQQFVIEMDTRTVPSAESIDTIHEVSGMECAMICTNINSCCSGTYEKSLEQCSLNLACNTTQEQSEGSQTIIKTSKPGKFSIKFDDLKFLIHLLST